MSTTNGIRVMLVDDHPVVRRGLKDVLEDSGGFDVVALAADGVEAVSKAEESRPDVIVMDVIMPRKDGVVACREIMDLLPDAKVLMLTAFGEDYAVLDAVAAGATGFVHKDSGGEDLVNAVRKVAQGELAIPDDAITRVFKLIRAGARNWPGPKPLTAREREILGHFARGRSYAQVAEVLGVKMMTVRNAIYRIQNKLGVGSRQELVVWAVRNGLVGDEEANDDAQPTAEE